MQFYVGKTPGPPYNAQYPCVYLRTDNWDDYTYGTTFNFYYCRSANDRMRLADVKILDKNSKSTTLPGHFERLENNYCSLGQDIDYYQKLVDLGKETYTEILIGLNDVVFNPDLSLDFLEEEGFEKSLLRFSEAEKAYREAGILFLQPNELGRKGFSFSFECVVPGAEGPHVVPFDFTQDATGLYRITALIGRNGTGKTQVLANFANALSGLNRDAGKFQPRRPSFSKVVAVFVKLKPSHQPG